MGSVTREEARPLAAAVARDLTPACEVGPGGDYRDWWTFTLYRDGPGIFDLLLGTPPLFVEKQTGRVLDRPPAGWIPPHHRFPTG